jgi:hypothetical protein
MSASGGVSKCVDSSASRSAIWWFSDDPTTSLIYFTLRLLKRLRVMATVPAMDYAAYIESAQRSATGNIERPILL